MELNHECLGYNSGKIYLVRYYGDKTGSIYIPLVNTFNFRVKDFEYLFLNKFKDNKIKIRYGWDTLEFDYNKHNYRIEFMRGEHNTENPSKEHQAIAEKLKQFLSKETLPECKSRKRFLLKRDDMFTSTYTGRGCPGFYNNSYDWSMDNSNAMFFKSEKSAQEYINESFPKHIAKTIQVVEGCETYYEDI